MALFTRNIFVSAQVHACSAMADFKHLTHVSLCSLIRLPSLHLVSAMFTLPQVLGTYLSIGRGSFTFTEGGSTVLMLKSRHTFLLMPATYGLSWAS